MLNRILPLLFVTLLAWSCSKPPTGIVLATVNLTEAPGPDAVVLRVVTTGSLVEYTGIEAPDGSVKVRIDGVEGYIGGNYVAFNAQPAAVLREQFAYQSPDDYSGFQVTEGTFVVSDSVYGNKTRIYKGGKINSGWVFTADLSREPADVEVATILSRLADSDADDEGRFVTFEQVARAHPGHSLFQTIKVDLSELPDEELAGIQGKYNVVLDKALNSIVMTKGQAREQAISYLEEILPPMHGDNADGYVNDEGTWQSTAPKEIYFFRFFAALPSFVKVIGKSEAVTWNHAPKEEAAKAYFLYRLDRSPDNLRNMYTYFRPLIDQLIVTGGIRDSRVEMSHLISVYNRITSMPNHEAITADISKKVAQWDREHADKDGLIPGGYAVMEQKPLYEPIINESFFESQPENMALWYHSFWVRRFAEGNQKAVYEILKNLVEIIPAAPAEAQGDECGECGDAEDGSDDDQAEGDDQIMTYECTFQDYSVGDCGHIEFDCGDFGEADVESLSAEDHTLWNNLIVSDNDGDRGNPEYVGKKFKLIVGRTDGTICNEGQGGQGRVPMLLEFKLVE